MFAKAFRVKTQNAIKGSDRKKLRAELASLYPSIPKEQLSDLVPNKEEMSVAKAHCFNGQTMHIYCLQKIPIFFDIDEIMYPSVYLLWRYPELLPAFRTWPPVLEKIQRGAVLMLPGIYVEGVVTPKALGNLQKSATCSIKLIGNNAPMAVGYTTMSSKDMVLDAGMKGKGVIPVHYYGDHMWEFGNKANPPFLHDPPVSDNGEYEKDVPEYLETGAGDTRLKDPDTVTEQASCDGDAPDILPEVERLTLEGEEENEGEEEDNLKIRQEQMDELLEWCFLHAIKTSLKRSELPILTSNFYRNQMLACCPLGKTLDIKKSSYKKLFRFLDEMKKRGIIKLKQQKDVVRITEVDLRHRVVRNFDLGDDKLAPKTETVMKENMEAAEPPTITTPRITEVYIVTPSTLPIFKPLGLTKGCTVTSEEVRDLLKRYTLMENLDGSQSSGFVTLDPILSQVLLKKDEYLAKLRHDELVTRCLAKMTVAHYIELNGHQSVLRKGKLQPVTIEVVTRWGSKKATLVENLELFGIDSQELAHIVQKGVACSTTVTPRPGKNNGFQVMVQGNQTTFITNLLLEKYHMKLKWITGSEKSGKSNRR